jgi:hypothetical protein
MGAPFGAPLVSASKAIALSFKHKYRHVPFLSVPTQVILYAFSSILADLFYKVYQIVLFQSIL